MAVAQKAALGSAAQRKPCLPAGLGQRWSLEETEEKRLEMRNSGDVQVWSDAVQWVTSRVKEVTFGYLGTLQMYYCGMEKCFCRQMAKPYFFQLQLKNKNKVKLYWVITLLKSQHCCFLISSDSICTLSYIFLPSPSDSTFCISVISSNLWTDKYLGNIMELFLTYFYYTSSSKAS